MRQYRNPNKAEKGLALAMLLMAVLCIPLILWVGPEFLMLQSILIVCFCLMYGKQPVSGHCQTTRPPAATEH